TACASSTHALGIALKLLQRGDAQIIISGGTEAAISPMALAISPADILEIIMGIKNGLTLPGPFSNNILCCFS
ncbi:unnamed protein product, partial [marine sediment metagenome]